VYSVLVSASSGLAAATDKPDTLLYVGAGVLVVTLISVIIRHGGFFMIGLAALCITAGFVSHLRWVPNPELWPAAPSPYLTHFSHLAVLGGMAVCFAAFLGIALRPGRARKQAAG